MTDQIDWIKNSMTREERLELEIHKLTEQLEKIRKGQYAKITGMEKKYNELRYEMDHINAHICKNNLR